MRFREVSPIDTAIKQYQAGDYAISVFDYLCKQKRIQVSYKRFEILAPNI